jgi:hypothetical protein
VEIHNSGTKAIQARASIFHLGKAAAKRTPDNTAQTNGNLFFWFGIILEITLKLNI